MYIQIEYSVCTMYVHYASDLIQNFHRAICTYIVHTNSRLLCVNSWIVRREHDV